MTKLLSLALAAALAAGAPVAFAAGEKKVDAEACKKAGDKMDAKMKAECDKLKASGEKKK